MTLITEDRSLSVKNEEEKMLVIFFVCLACSCGWFPSQTFIFLIVVSEGLYFEAILAIPALCIAVLCESVMQEAAD